MKLRSNAAFWTKVLPNLSRCFAACLLGPLLSPCLSTGAESTPPPLANDSHSFKLEIQRSIDRGLDWFKVHQNAEGWWSSPDHPALTALPVLAFQGDPRERFTKDNAPWLTHALAYLASNQKPDGGLHRGQLMNYNTALGMLALLGAGDASHEDLILKARAYLIRLQMDFGEPGFGDHVLDGGLGYGSSYPHSDMANTLQALEAIYYSRHVARDTGNSTLQDLDWNAALQFIQNCQNLSSHNKQSWVSDDPDQKGGFVYFPGQSKAGAVTNDVTQHVALRSYGSISYAGLLSYIYADLQPDDPRVEAVLEWLKSHYTLEENPGMGPQGLFYYYHTMAKALAKSGQESLRLADGRVVPWRHELAQRLINLQKADGSWINDAHGRWWEKDPVLVTAYAVLALEHILHGM